MKVIPDWWQLSPVLESGSWLSELWMSYAKQSSQCWQHIYHRSLEGKNGYISILYVILINWNINESVKERKMRIWNTSKCCNGRHILVIPHQLASDIINLIEPGRTESAGQEGNANSCKLWLGRLKHRHSLNGRIIVNWILKISTLRDCKLDWTGSRLVPMESSCEYGNDHLTLNEGNFWNGWATIILWRNVCQGVTYVIFESNSLIS